METFRKAYIYVRDVFAGILEESDDGYIFRYDPDYLKKETNIAQYHSYSFREFITMSIRFITNSGVILYIHGGHLSPRAQRL